MPELPEVETVCRTLRPLVVGQTILSAEVYWPRTVDPIPTAEYTARIAGHTVSEVTRRAKLIVFGFDTDLIMTVHLRMTGKLLFVAEGEPSPDEPETHLRLRLRFESGDELLFFDARKFGRIRLYNGAEWQNVQSSYGPEPLDRSLTPAEFANRLLARQRQIKPLLLDQTFIAGIGNIYADEALYKARIHPLQIASSVSPRKAGALLDAIVETLESSIANSGTTLRDYRSALGAAGTNQRQLYVYGSAPGTPCPRCETPLKRIVVGQRGTTFCPRCQRLR